MPSWDEYKRDPQQPNTDSTQEPGTVGPELASVGAAPAGLEDAYQGMTWAQAKGSLGSSNSWLAGSNADSTESGFSSTFYDKWMRADKDAADRYLSSRQALDLAEPLKYTGVNLWEEKKVTPDGKHAGFGDVYEDGKKVTNVFDSMDENGANTLIWQWLKGSDAGELFQSEDYQQEVATLKTPTTPVRTLQQAVEDARKQNEDTVNTGERAMQLAKDTAEQDWAYGTAADTGIAGGGAVGGALVGAGIASIVPVVGPIAGGIVGGIVGGVGAYLNRDELQTQMARGKVLVDYAGRQADAATAMGERLKMYGGLAVSAVSPVTNAYHGVYDLTGDLGDQKSEWQNDVQAGGIGSWLLQAGNVATMFADGAGTFGARAARTTYMLGTGANTVGGATQLATGRAWDYTHARFDDTRREEDGSFDLSGQLAQAGVVAIDAVQTLLPAALSGARKDYATARDTGRMSESVTTEGRHSFGALSAKFDDTGRAEQGSLRFTWRALAPSELFPALTGYARAIRAAASRADKTILADDVYRFTEQISKGANARLVSVMTGIGEGMEEVVQAVLEPMQSEGLPVGEDLLRAYLSGMGAGAGMGFASARGRHSLQERQLVRANMLASSRGEPMMDIKTFAKLSPREQESRSTGSTPDEEALAATAEKAVESARNRVTGSVYDVNAIADLVREQYEAGLQGMDTRTRTTSRLVGSSTVGLTDNNGYALAQEKRIDGVEMTVGEVVQVLSLRQADLQKQLEMIPEVEASLDSTAPDHAERVQDLQDTRRDLTEAIARSRELVNQIRELVSLRGTDRTQRVTINEFIRKAYDSSDRGRRLAATVFFARFPTDNPNSIIPLMPQASLIEDETATGGFAVDGAYFAGMGADLDGDLLNTLNALMTARQFDVSRSGQRMIGLDGKFAVAAHTNGEAFGALILDLKDDRTQSAQIDTAISRIQRRLTGILARVGGLNDLQRHTIVASYVDTLRSKPSEAEEQLLSSLAHPSVLDAVREAGIIGQNIPARVLQVIRSEHERLANEVTFSKAKPREGRRAEVPPGVTRTPKASRVTGGVSPLERLQVLMDQTEIFRIFTGLNYSGQRSTAENVANISGSQLDDFIAFWDTVAGQGISADELEAQQGFTTAITRLWIQRLARGQLVQGMQLDPMTAEVVLANTETAELEVDEDVRDAAGNVVKRGTYQFTGRTTGKTITVAQQLYRMALNLELQTLGATIYSNEARSQAFHKRMSLTFPGNGNAADVFMDVYGDLLAGELLGRNIGNLRAGQTMRQLVRYLDSLPVEQRAREIQTLENHPLWQGRDNNSDIPFRLSEVVPDANNEVAVTPYHAFVRVAAEMANRRLTRYNGRIIGSLGDTKSAAQRNFATAYEAIQKAFVLYVQDNPIDAAAGETATTKMQQMLATQPRLVNLLWQILPRDVAMAIVDPSILEGDPNGTFEAWLYEAFTKPDLKTAAAHFHSRMLFSQWVAFGIPAQQAAADEDRMGVPEGLRAYTRLPRELQALYILGRQENGLTLQTRFLNSLLNMTDVDAWYESVNSDPIIASRMAPLVPWVSDAGEFDEDLPGQGWAGPGESLRQREALIEFAGASKQLLASITIEEVTRQEDSLRANESRDRIITHLRNGGSIDTLELDTDARNAEMAQRHLDMNAKYGARPGMNAMLEMLIGLMSGINAHSQNKGETIPAGEAWGNYLVTYAQFGSDAEPLSMLGSLAAVSDREVASNLPKLANDVVDMTTTDGETIQVRANDLLTVLELHQDPNTRGLAEALLFPYSYDGTSEFGTRMAPMMGQSLSQLFGGDYLQHIAPRDGKPLTDTQAIYYLAEHAAAQAATSGGSLEDVPNKIMEIALSLQASARVGTSVLSDEEAVWTAATTLARILQANTSRVGRKVDVGGQLVSELSETSQQLQRDLRERYVQAVFGITSEDASLVRINNKTVREWVEGTLLVAAEQHQWSRVIESLAELNAISDSSDLFEQYQAGLKTTALQIDAMDELATQIKRVLDDNAVDTILDDYALTAIPKRSKGESDASYASRVSSVESHNELVKMNILTRTKDARFRNSRTSQILRILDRNGRRTWPGTRTSITDEEWQTLSDNAVDVMLADLVGPGSHKAVAAIMSEKMLQSDERRLLDPTYYQMLAPLFDETSPWLRAGTVVRQTAFGGPTATDAAADTGAKVVLDRLITVERAGSWSTQLVERQKEATRRTRSVAAARSISGFGNLAKTVLSMTESFRRTWRPVEDSLLSTVTVRPQDLTDPRTEDVYARQLNSALASPDGSGTQPAKTDVLSLEGAYFRKANLHFVDDTGAVYDIPLAYGPGASYNSMVDEHMARTLGSLHPFDQENSTLRHTSIGQIQDVMSQLIEMGAQPDSIEISFNYVDSRSKPAGEDYAMNAFFLGAGGPADAQEDQLSPLFSVFGGINNAGQAGPLSSTKKGRPAKQIVQLMEWSAKQAINSRFITDLQGVLQEKALHFMSAEMMLEGPLPTTVNKNILALLNQLHYVRIGDSLYTADEIIRDQAGPNKLDMTTAELVQLSMDELRTILEAPVTITNGEGRARAAKRGASTTSRRITGVANDIALRRFGSSTPGKDVRSASFASVARSRKQPTPSRARSYDLRSREQRLVRDNRIIEATISARADEKAMNLQAIQREGRRLLDHLVSTTPEQSLTMFGINFGAANGASLARAAKKALERFFGEQPTRMIWSYEHASLDARNVFAGQLTQTDLGKPSENSALVQIPGDAVIINLDSFDPQNGPEQLSKVLRHFATRGVIIGFSGGTGRLGWIQDPDVADLLRQFHYETPGRTSGMWFPLEREELFRSARLLQTSLTESTIVKRNERVLAFIADEQQLGQEEGELYVNPEDTALNDNATLSTLLRTGAYSEFNAMLLEELDTTRKTEAMAAMRNLADDRVAIGQMLVASRGWSSDQAIDQFQSELKQLIDSIDSGLMPKEGSDFAPGMLIPLLSNDPVNPRIFFHRYGFKDPADLDAAFTSRSQGSSARSIRFAVGTTVADDRVTTRSGSVKRYERVIDGIRVHLTQAMQLAKAKILVRGMGWKGTNTASEQAKARLAPGPVFEQGQRISFITEAKGVSDKRTGFDGIHNAQSAIAVLGLQGVAAKIAETLFSNLYNRDPQAAVDQTERFLDAFHKAYGGQLTESAAYEQIHMRGPLGDFDQMLARAGLTPAERSLEDVLVEQDAGALLTRTTLLYLMSEGSAVDNILYLPGFARLQNTNDDLGMAVPPFLWSSIFDNRLPTTQPLRTWFIGQLNQAFTNMNNADQNFAIDPSYTVTMERFSGPVQTQGLRRERGRRNVQRTTGTLAIPRPLLDDESNVSTGSATETTGQREDFSQHNAFITRSVNGGIEPVVVSAAEKKIRALDRSLTPTFAEIQADERAAAERLILTLLLSEPENDPTYQASMKETRASTQYASLAFETTKTIRHAVARPADKAVADKMDKAALNLVDAYGLQPSQAYVADWLVRGNLGAMWMVDDEGVQRGEVSPAAYVESAKMMTLLADEHYLPNVWALGSPVLDREIFDMIYTAERNQGSNPKFTLREIVRDDTAHTNGVVRRRRDRKGLPSIRETNEKLTADRYDQEMYNRWALIALGSVVLDDVQFFSPAFQTLADGFFQTWRRPGSRLLGLGPSMDLFRSLDLLNNETNEIAASIDRGRTQVLGTINDDRGAVDVFDMADLLVGQMIQTRYGTKIPPSSEMARMIERQRSWYKEGTYPTPLEKGFRSLRERGMEVKGQGLNKSPLIPVLHNLAFANSTINPGLWVGSFVERSITRTLEAATNLAIGSGQIAELHDLYRQTSDALGRSADWRGAVNRDMYYRAPTEGGRILRGTAALARFGQMFLDADRGGRQTRDARLYLDAVARESHSIPDFDMGVAMIQMRANPLWLKSNHPDLHLAGVMAVERNRNMQQGFLASAMQGVIDPLSTSSHSAFNFMGNTLLGIPLMFRNYTINTLQLLTGTQMLSPLLAMAFDGRRKGVVGSFQKFLSGGSVKYGPEERYNLESILAGVDFSRMFVQAGLTHVSLLSLGTMLGGLNLSGEDEETKRRRRLGRLRGGQMWYDPRELASDWRNQNSIFVDDIPFINILIPRSNDPETRTLAQLPWMLNIFAQPVIGMTNYFESGDMRDISRGFMNAIGSLPYSGDLSLIGVFKTADMLSAAAETAESSSDDEFAEAKATRFLTSFMGYWERKLFENAWLSSLYVALDEYDRDPWVLPGVDSDGNVQVDANGNPIETTSLSEYVDENGNVKQGYADPSAIAIAARQYGERNLTFAALSQLFTGFSGKEGSAWRYSMPVKTRKIERVEPTEQEINQTLANALSIIDEDGNEIVTQNGAEAIMLGVVNGYLKADAEVLKGVYIPHEMRLAITEKWIKDWAQEGVDLGLDPDTALSRAKELFYGPYGDESYTAIGDVLFDYDNIPNDPTIFYQQLNTTYVMGPSGYPVATGFARSKYAAAFGLPLPNLQYSEADTESGQDERLNVQNDVYGFNTGQRATRARSAPPVPPEKLLADIEEAINKAAEDFKKAFDNGGYGYNNGWHNYGRGYGSGYRRGGGSSGYATRSNYISPYFQRFQPAGPARVPYGNSVRYPQLPDTYVRRATVRRERISSERGRLLQWQ